MSEVIDTLNLLEVQIRVSEADEQIIRADERAKVLAKVANLKNEYTDACNMCTKIDCDVCAISNFIDQLENIISNK